ncbi:MAG: hypothetical protein IJ086_13775 [Clostridium sp.]|nr:hypothetical protein [Clostridium sp.]
MENSIYKTYKEEIELINSNDNVSSILLVGSSKNINFELDYNFINDIDIFIIVKEGPYQERIIKERNGIEFDINYFSIKGVYKFIEEKEYFFLKEMKDAKVIYNKDKNLNNIISLCRVEYNKGPKLLSEDEKKFIKIETLSKLERLKVKDKYEDFEYKFLINVYLKDLIIAFFNINNKWIPKDKKLITTIKQEDIVLYNLVKKVNQNYLYEDLFNVYKYIFKDINITTKDIKIT